MRTWLESEMTAGRNDNVCGQTGVIRIAGTLGATMQPPALIEYAVLPVGVALQPGDQLSKLQEG